MMHYTEIDDFLSAELSTFFTSATGLFTREKLSIPEINMHLTRAGVDFDVYEDWLND